MGDIFEGPHLRALEEAFFAHENEVLRQRLIEEDVIRSRKAALAAASGVGDDAVLERLVALKVGPDTLVALALVPLVAVAWADGELDGKERVALLQAATEAGVPQQGPARALLEGWLRTPPPGELLAAWMDYARAVCAGLEPAAKAALRDAFLGRARRVAEAAGGFLGLTPRISPAEAAMLTRLEGAFLS